MSFLSYPAVDIEVGKINGVILFGGNLVGSGCHWINRLRSQHRCLRQLQVPPHFSVQKEHIPDCGEINELRFSAKVNPELKGGEYVMESPCIVK